MSGEPTYLRFDADDPTDLVVAVEALLEAGRGGWVNVEPDVDDDDAVDDDQFGLFKLFSARGPAVPMATVVAPHLGGRRPVPASIGLQHGAGPKALDQLADGGVRPGSGWRQRQDHPKRGLVLELPADVAGDEVVAFVIEACRCLCPFPTGRRWYAMIH